MGRTNQNSKWKSHQQPEPTIVEVKSKVKTEPQPLKVVEVPVGHPLAPTGPIIAEQEEVKPVIKKVKKVEE